MRVCLLDYECSFLYSSAVSKVPLTHSHLGQENSFSSIYFTFLCRSTQKRAFIYSSVRKTMAGHVTMTILKPCKLWKWLFPGYPVSLDVALKGSLKSFLPADR